LETRQNCLVLSLQRNELAISVHNAVEQGCSSGRGFLTSMSTDRPQGDGLLWPRHTPR